jgi:hypothetical protein
MAAISLEPFSQTFFLVHRSHFPVAFRHPFDERGRLDVTGKIVPPATSSRLPDIQHPEFENTPEGDETCKQE